MRRLRGSGLPLVILALLATLAAGPEPVASTPATPTAVEARSGAGIWGKALCIGCAVTLIGAGGATFGTIAVTAAIAPEPFVVCGAICVMAFTE